MKSHSRDSRRPFQGTIVAILFVLAAATAGWAQKDMGSIVGVVKDGTGAVVTDAKVIVTDVDRGTVFNTTTNSSGEYVAGLLRIGQYTVAVEKSAFKRALAGPVLLRGLRLHRQFRLSSRDREAKQFCVERKPHLDSRPQLAETVRVIRSGTCQC